MPAKKKTPAADDEAKHQPPAHDPLALLSEVTKELEGWITWAFDNRHINEDTRAARMSLVIKARQALS